MADANSNTGTAGRNPNATKVLKLSSQLFAELDLIARRQGGRAITVSTFEEMGNAWGTYSFMSGSGCIDARKPYGPGSMCDLSTIQLACEINIHEFRSVIRPEMDWNFLSDDEIYHFILWHEIGHALNNFCEIELFTSDAGKKASKEDPLIRGKIRMLNEVLADRYAWNQLYPERPMPKTKGGVARFQQIERDLSEMSKILKLRHYPPRAIPEDPWAYIPTQFIESDEYFYLLGDPKDLTSKAAVLLNAWKELPFYVGNMDWNGRFERVSSFVPDIATAIFERNMKVNKYPMCQIYQIPADTELHAYRSHRVVDAPSSQLKVSERERFENSHLPVGIIGFQGDRVILSSNDENTDTTTGFGYQPIDVLNNPKIPGRLQTKDTQELLARAKVQFSEIVGWHEDNPALYEFEEPFWAVIDRGVSRIVSGPFLMRDAAKAEETRLRAQGIKYAVVVNY